MSAGREILPNALSHRATLIASVSASTFAWAGFITTLNFSSTDRAAEVGSTEISENVMPNSNDPPLITALFTYTDANDVARYFFVSACGTASATSFLPLDLVVGFFGT